MGLFAKSLELNRSYVYTSNTHRTDVLRSGYIWPNYRQFTLQECQIFFFKNTTYIAHFITPNIFYVCVLPGRKSYRSLTTNPIWLRQISENLNGNVEH